VRDQIKAALAVVLVGGLVYVAWVQFSGKDLLPAGSLPKKAAEPDTSRLAELKGIASVTGAAAGAGTEYNLGGRNLFQYGLPKPPPPSPAELEAMRKAEEARLKAMEEDARRRADQQRQAQELERQAREAQEALARQKQPEQAAAKPAEPPKPPPPPINLRLVGYLGPPKARIAVFLSGKEIVLGRKGDVIDGKFKVLSLGHESVEMGYVDPAHEGVKKKVELGS